MNEKIFKMSFSSVYPLYLKKIERKVDLEKNIIKNNLDSVIFWLTWYEEKDLEKILGKNIDFENFFENSPKINENIWNITWTICGCKIQEIENPLMKNIRILDKLVDDLSKWKSPEKIFEKYKKNHNI